MQFFVSKQAVKKKLLTVQLPGTKLKNQTKNNRLTALFLNVIWNFKI